MFLLSDFCVLYLYCEASTEDALEALWKVVRSPMHTFELDQSKMGKNLTLSLSASHVSHMLCSIPIRDRAEVAQQNPP
jgi:hypothetical protein